jgi:hypothetical protein
MLEEDKLRLKNKLQLQDDYKNIEIRENTFFKTLIALLKERF